MISLEFQDGLDKAKVMVAFCFDDYGEHTGVGFETYDELRRPQSMLSHLNPVDVS